MIGIFIGVIASWGLLYWTKNIHLALAGFQPILKRLGQFALGFLLTAGLCVGVQWVERALQSAAWQINSDFNATLLISRLWWDFKSVLTEELLFRGVLLLILIRWIGPRKSVLISAVAFGVYHWFSFGIFGSIVPMFFVGIGTGMMGYAWALAFAKTKSIFLPLGFHLGWNFTLNTIFSKGPLSNGLIVTLGGSPLPDWWSLLGLWGVPLILCLVVAYAIREQPAYAEVDGR